MFTRRGGLCLFVFACPRVVVTANDNITSETTKTVTVVFNFIFSILIEWPWTNTVTKITDTLTNTKTERLLQLRHDATNHRPMDIGQSEITSGISIGQPFVIESQQVQQRGM
ncbi:MAG: hypothetical protein ACI9TH_002654 [Kiritimatiellia bacterium]|jgi:hypothetical protein